jgi:uncharacterized RDD family membrane protein YckC
MSEQPTSAGWFDDPENPDQLRYFDGILWTKNVTPKRTRAAAPAPQVSPPPQNPYAAGHSTTPAPNPYAAQSAPPVPVGARRLLTTADGIPLASYGLRVAAYIIDSIIVGLLGLLVGGWFLVKAMTPVLDALGDLATATPDDINAAIALLDVRYVGYYSAVALILSMAYHFFFLTRWSATPGKRMLGISVRRTDRAGVLDVGSASRRVAFTSLLSALGNLPFIGFVALAATVADLLWPLSDPRRQALHDKVADTQVVVGHQKR